jgi:type IV secretion system protein VirB9
MKHAVYGLALAMAIPAAAQDARVATRDYVENQVIGFAARQGFQSTIAFGDGERIENIALGDSAAWQVTPNRRANLLFVKPMTAKAPVTNMTVVTDRHTYLFELRQSRAVPTYLLRFAYAPEPAPPPVSVPPDAITPPAAAGGLPLHDLNFAWTTQGVRGLWPERVFDDGQSVYLAWRAGQPLPAVLALAPDGKTEAPVNFSVDGPYLVVMGFHSHLILRSGKDMATIDTQRPTTTPPQKADDHG